MGAFTKLFSRLRITSDPNVSTQTSAVITADTTNANLVIAPNGTGALVASIPDGTVNGGNARGAAAVDLQIALRGAATQVASGIVSVIGGGSGNTASGARSTISGGLSNTASGNQSFVGGGQFNSSQDNYAVVAGGLSNTASNLYSTISGGQSNTASTNTHATVVGGTTNTSSGIGSTSGGSANIASGQSSVSFGNSNQATARFSTALGLNSKAYLYNQLSVGAVGSSFGFVNGSSQYSSLVASAQKALTTGNTASVTLDGDEGNLIIPTGNNRMWNVTIKYVAVVTTITGTATGVTVGDTKSQNIEIGFKKVGGASSLVGGGSFSIPQEDASMGSASLIPTAGGSQELALTFTAPTFAGGGSVTCRVVAKVELVEVAY